MGSGERAGKRATFNGPAEGNCGGIDTNFTNSPEFTQASLNQKLLGSCQFA